MSRPSNFDASWGDFLGGAVSIVSGQTAGGMGWKGQARVASTADVDITALGPGDAIDGVTVAEGDRVLLKEQADATENGLYEVPASGTADRTIDMDTPSDFPGAYVPVAEGTVNGAKVFRCTNTTPPELGVDDIIFEEFGTPGSAGSGDVVPHGTLGATETMDFGDGTWHWGTLDQDCDITLAGAIAGRDCGLTVEVIEDGAGGHTPTFISAGSVIWLGGTVPTHDTTADTTTIYGFLCRDGSTWIGGVLGGSAGSAGDLDDLGDVTITAPAEDDTLRYRAGVWVNDDRQFRPVTHDFGSGPELVWDGDDLVMEWF